jgi:hypothetical protein
VPDTANDQTSATSGTGAGLLAFITYLIEKNEMVAGTASALRTGCAKVLSIEDDPAAVDLRTGDVGDILRRFRIRSRAEIKEQSLDEYERRFRQAVTMYRKWLDGDPDWRPKSRPAGGSSAGSKKSDSTTTAGQRGSAKPAGKQSVIPAPPAQPGMVTYPIVIRPGVRGSIVLPENLSKKEAQRVASFVTALALEEQLAITAGVATAG